ncbi:MAG: RagB/SusD family nutrient uptake outer membrane protein, partial [Arenibacter algicola]
PMVWKFTAGAYDPTNRSDWGLNYSLMRYTEILLMKAECINELNGPTTEAINIINMIRTRANLPDLTPSDTSDDSSFFSAIVRERRHELFYEGHRWFDLVRWGIAQEVINAFLEVELPTEAAARMSEKHNLFPIPSQQIEIIGDESVLWQNPGW